MATYDHLNPMAQAITDQESKARLAFINTDHWIQYDRAEEILSSFEALLQAPPINRPLCYILLGSTQNGKTSVLKEFANRHPFERGTGRYGALTPVIFTIAPTKPDEAKLEEVILQGYDNRFHPKNALHRRGMIATSIRNGGTKILLIDEIQQMFKGRSIRNPSMLEALKDYSNRYGISVVIAGTPEAYLTVQTNPQIANRFKPLFLPLWKPGPEVLKFIAAYERILPLRKPSGLTSKEIASHLVERMEGMIGELVELLRFAAEKAIITGEERITLQLLASIDHLPASKRKDAAEAYVRSFGLRFPNDVQS